MISFYTLTDSGGRDHNEDLAAVMQKKGKWCCVLADGLGGMGGGADAAACVVDTIREHFESGYLTEDTLMECCQSAHRTIRQLREARKQVGGLFSTVVLLLGDKKHLYWTHCGDSRLYLFKGTDLIFQTKDHSVPQMLAACGEIAEEEIRNHPDRNRLLSCLGVEEEEARLSPLGGMELCSGLSALLCSDGFWELVTEEQMVDTLNRAHSVKAWLEAMRKIVKESSEDRERDNFTAVGMWYL